MSIHRKNSGMRGFSLVELSIVFMIAGIMMLGAIKFIVPLYEKAKYLETQEKMRVINEAIDAYALKNFRIPCPADPNTTPVNGEPYGTERFSTATGDVIPANCGATAANWTGIVPYQTLGLPENTIRDSWGRNFTYAISPAFALDTSDAAIPVHAVCRMIEWYYPKDDLSTVVHKNPRKARFCCPGNAGGNNIYAFNTDLVIRSRVNGALVNGLANANPRQATGNGNPNTCTNNACEAYAPTTEVFTLTPNVTVPKNESSTGAAFILISHGRNGIGAFLNDGTQLNPGTGGPDENENSNGDRIFIERNDISENAADLYDDFVLWRTQDLIFAEQGESCVKP